MNVTVLNTVSINEDDLIDKLHKLHPSFSIDETMDWLADEEGDEYLMNWLSSQTSASFECLDDYSYEELIEYVENNF